MKRVAVFAFAIALSLVDTAQAEQETRYAILVGANYGKGPEVPLQYAVEDANRVAEVLTTVGGFLAENVVLLSQPTPDRLRDALARLYVRIRAEGAARSVLLIYYSGHADAAALHLGNAEMPWDELRNLTAGSPATSRLLIIDACRSGQATRVKGSRLTKPFAVPAEPDLLPEGFAVLSSATAGESAQESDDLRGSFFTHHFVSGLRGVADANGDGAVSLPESYQYAADRTVASTASTLAGIQHPTYLYALKGRIDLVITRPRKYGADLALVRMGRPGQYLFRIDGAHGRPLLEANVSTGVREAHLLPGRYLIQRRVPERLYEGTVVLAARQTLEVDNLAMRSMQYDRLVRKGGGVGPSTSVAAWIGRASGLLPNYVGGAQLSVEASMDFSTLTADVQVSHWESTMFESLMEGKLRGWTASFGGRKVVDVGPVSLSTGLRVGLGYLRQTYDAPYRKTTPRTQWAVPFVEATVRADVPLRSGFFIAVSPYLRVAGVRVREEQGDTAARPQVVVVVGGGKRW